jgi:hypothetical protein
MYHLQWQHIKPIVYLFADSNSTRLSSKDWKKILSLPVLAKAGGEKTETKAAQKLREVTTALEPFVSAAELDNMVVALPGPLESTPILPLMEGMEMTWELCELNFRMELRLLDSKCCPPLVTTGLSEVDAELAIVDWDLARRTEICKCFDPPIFSPVTFESANKGLALTSCEERRPYSQQFWKVMNAWMDAKPQGWRKGIDSTLTDAEFHKWECMVVVFYVQTFYMHVGRLPVFPRLLPADF